MLILIHLFSCLWWYYVLIVGSKKLQNFINNSLILINLLEDDPKTWDKHFGFIDF